MSNQQNQKERGEQFTDALSDALSTGDFSILNDLVSQALTDALRDAGKQIKKNLNEPQTHQRRERKAPVSPAPKPAVKKTVVPVKFTEVGNVSGILQQVFGGIGLGITGLIALFRLPGLLLGSISLGSWLINLIFPAIFFGVIRFGVIKRARLQRARRYIQLCGSKMYGQIETLARDTGKSIRYVTKDISKMLSLGMFPEGHLDDQKTCFMLNDAIHRQYLETKNNYLLQQKEQQKNASPPASASASMNTEEETELKTMITEGMDCIRRLQELNNQIPGEIISRKLYRLESLLKDIFHGVKAHPEQMSRMHSMMDYYLPTTLKLVEAYRDFDKIQSPGTEVAAAKDEIERTLDIINQAFAELLDNLFQDTVFDVTTDAQVLKTMLAKGGLTGNTDFTDAG